MMRAIAICVVLFGTGFILNFVWEALHGVYLYRDHDMRASRYVPMLIYVSVVDGLLILGLAGWTALLRRDLFRHCGSDRGWMPVFGLSAIILAAGIEYVSVYVQGRWAYLPAMPTVFGIGISPLFQLAVTGLIAVGMGRCVPRCRWKGGINHDEK